MLAKFRTTLYGPILSAVLLSLAGPMAAQDSVTVPKSRLEELERKEKELERLKGESPKDNVQTAQPKPKPEPETHALPPVLAPAPEPVIRYSSPALESLPPLQPYDVIDSMDLANYYHADSAAADRRFRKQKIAVRGEIVGFEKPIWKRNYRILLKSPVPGTRVICDLLPPDKCNAIFTTNHGDDLVGMFGEKRLVLAKVGQKVMVKGECKGPNDSAVMIYGWEAEVFH